MPPPEPLASLREVPTAAISYALGMAVASARTRAPGRIAALVEELARRDELTALHDALGPDASAALSTAYTMDSGARLAAAHRIRASPAPA